MSNTAHRSYPRPVPENNVSDDVLLLQQALDLVDGDIHLLFAAISTLAPVVHEHAIADVVGLSAALAGKSAVGHTHSLDDLSDVDGASAGATGYVLAKQADGTYGPVSPAAVVGGHGHVIGDIVDLETALDLLDGAAQIDAATEVAVQAGDFFGFRTVAGAFVKATWSSLRAATTVAWGGNLANRTEKTTLVDADLIGLADSEATNATVKATLLNLVAYIVGKVASAANFRANTNGLLGVNNVWASAVPVNLGDWSGNITLNLSTFIKGYATATGNFQFNTLSTPKNQSGTIRVTASGGNRTPSFATGSFCTPDNKALSVIASGTTRLYSYDYDSVLGKCLLVDMGTVS